MTEDRKSVVANHKNLLLIVLLVLLTAGAYLHVTNNGFITYFDDDLYITANSHFGSGMNADFLKWAFTSFYANNWHPLTWLSHALDYRLYGMEAAGHHLTSLLIHIANTVLLFLVFVHITGCRARSFFVAALFAVHPLHVESVAWVAERKDVLGTLFWLLTMWMYGCYVRRPHILRYITAILLFALGLMAKPMLVSLPIVLLLLDFWPLRRMQKGWMRLIAEKVPFFVLAAASCVVTMFAQSRTGAVGTLELLPLGARIANAFVAYVAYIRKMFWPADLAVFYPHPLKGLPAWDVCVAAMLFAAITLAAVILLRKRPYIAMGWLWYVVTLVPVIGLVQVGRQAMADRYTYIPLIGLFVILVWLIPDLMVRKDIPSIEKSLGIGAFVIVLLLARSTAKEISYWSDSSTLFGRALEVEPNNSVMHFNLGNLYRDEGEGEKAVYHFQEAARIGPAHPDIYLNLGGMQLRLKEPVKAAASYRKALELNPKDLEAHRGLGMAFEVQKKYSQAELEYFRALQINSKDANVYRNLGGLYSEVGVTDAAIKAFRAATILSPRDARAHLELGSAFADKGQLAEAIAEFREAIRLDPEIPDSYVNLAVMLYQKANYADAWKEIQTGEQLGIQYDPRFLTALSAKMPRPN